MATLALGLAGSAIGGSIGGSFLGVGAATVGGFVGRAAGGFVDSWLFGGSAQTQRIEGQRLDAIQVTTATEGAVVPRVFGRMRVGTTLIWATDFREEIVTTTSGGGGKGLGGGGGGSVERTEYLYHASFALALCEGEIGGVGRIWTDGKLLDTTDIDYRVHRGGEDQSPDPLIASLSENAPAYRGTAYLVFEDLALARFGNRIPQFSVEVVRPNDDPDSMENSLRAITMIPSAGEFVYANEPVTRGAGEGVTVSENVHAEGSTANMIVALDQLQVGLPKTESVSLVVSWFGNDLRVGECTVKPRVEIDFKETAPLEWSVSGLKRADAPVVSSAGGKPAFGGTPSDESVVQAITELKARGLRVTFYPFIMMDIPATNALPNPYSSNASSSGQPAFPWRGRITCSPAPGQAGSADKAAHAASQVSAFFGQAAPDDLGVEEGRVVWIGEVEGDEEDGDEESVEAHASEEADGDDVGGDDDDEEEETDRGEWTLRRMILHYAHLCNLAGGVDAFLIGTEMRGLTTIRSGPSTYPAVSRFTALLADVRGILGAGTKIGYAADWSEYFGHQPGDGSGDVHFHLDPLWSHPQLDFIGIDNYMPLADWRDGEGHADALAGWSGPYDVEYLKSNVRGGEGYDWFYASVADREAQIRTPISDGAGKPWVFRYKAIQEWWSNPHHNRPGDTESAAATAWVPQSKPIRFTEFGCPAVEKGSNQPNVFHDPQSSESFFPYFSNGVRDDAAQRRYIEATLGWWNDPANNPVSTVYSAPMVDMGEAAAWTWDARPYPAFPALTDVWADGPNWEKGHWLTGRVGIADLGMVVRELALRGGLTEDQIDTVLLSAPVPGYRIDALESPRVSISSLARFYGFDAVESGGVIRFAPRTAKASRVFETGDLVVASGGGEAYELVRAQESELPAALKWTILRSDEEYDTFGVEAQRQTDALDRVASESFALSHFPGEAGRQVSRALSEVWTGRESVALSLPPSALALDPGDVFALRRAGDIAFRISSASDALARGIEGVRVGAGAYDLGPGPDVPSRPTRPSITGTVETAFLDIPQISEETPAHRPYIAARADPWVPMAVHRSIDGESFARVQTLTAPATMGELLEELPAGPLWRFDTGNAVLVTVRGRALASVTDGALFARANALALETAPGVWEILQFGTAELIATGRYRLSRLLRGQRGTEAAMAAVAPVGSRIVLLDDAVTALPVTVSDLSLDYAWRVGPASKAATDSGYRETAFTPEGIGLRPFSPVHIRAAGAPGDIALSWIRRSRALSADSWAGVEVPMIETPESYEIDILDGGTVLRTLAASSPSVPYTAAQQAADFGAALAPGDPLSVAVHQISARVGRGPARPVTLSL